MKKTVLVVASLCSISAYAQGTTQNTNSQVGMRGNGSEKVTFFIGGQNLQASENGANLDQNGLIFGAEVSANEFVSIKLTGAYTPLDGKSFGIDSDAVDGWIYDTRLMGKLGYPIHLNTGFDVKPYVQAGLGIQSHSISTYGYNGWYSYELEDSDTSIGLSYGAGIEGVIGEHVVLDVGYNALSADDTTFGQTAITIGYRY